MTAAPLVVFTDTGVCDGPVEHEVRLITDGRMAYAYTLGSSGSDARGVERQATLLRVLCGGPGRDGYNCDGDAYFTLTDPAGWSADPDDIQHLRTHGTRIEVD